MKTKGFFIFLIISILILFTSCAYIDLNNINLGIEGILRVKINKDFQAFTELDLLINTTALNIISIAINPIEELKKDFEGKGYNTEIYTKEDKTGIRAYKQIDNIEEVLDVIAYSYREQPSIEKNSMVSSKEGWFYNTYYVNTSFNLLGEFSDYNIVEKIPTNLILNQIDFRLILELPIPVEEHNATNISRDGKVLEWDIVPTMNNAIMFQIKVPNIWNIAMSSIFGTSCLLIGIYYVISRLRLPN